MKVGGFCFFSVCTKYMCTPSPSPTFQVETGIRSSVWNNDWLANRLTWPGELCKYYSSTDPIMDVCQSFECPTSIWIFDFMYSGFACSYYFPNNNRRTFQWKTHLHRTAHIRSANNTDINPKLIAHFNLLRTSDQIYIAHKQHGQNGTAAVDAS